MPSKKKRRKEATPPARTSPQDAVVNAPPSPRNSKAAPRKPPGKAVAPAKVSQPEELASIWDREISAAWSALNNLQRQFTVEYIKCRFKGAPAYKAAYNPDAEDGVARSYASQLLTNVNIRTILKRLQDTSLEDMFLVRNVLVEATAAYKPEMAKNSEGKEFVRTDIPDFANRIKAAAELREFHRERLSQVPAEGGAIPASFTNNFNFYLQQMGMEPMKLPESFEDAEVIEEKSVTKAAPRRGLEDENDFGASFKKFAGEK